jgi:beta-lactamase class A
MVRNVFMSRSNKGATVLAGLLVLFFSAAVLPAAGQDKPVLSGLQRLDKQIRDVFKDKDGEVGVSLLHVESGRELAVNGETLFPMASAFKVPILVEVMFQAREGKFALDDEGPGRKTDQHLGSGMLRA